LRVQSVAQAKLLVPVRIEDQDAGAMPRQQQPNTPIHERERSTR